jgi:hypothetical protein
VHSGVWRDHSPGCVLQVRTENTCTPTPVAAAAVAAAAWVALLINSSSGSVRGTAVERLSCEVWAGHHAVLHAVLPTPYYTCVSSGATHAAAAAAIALLDSSSSCF